MAERTRVVVAGFGRLGSELARGLAQSDEVEIAGIARRTLPEGSLTLGGREVPVSTDLPALLDQTRPRVLLEASLPEAAERHVRAALERGVSPEIGRASCRERV